MHQNQSLVQEDHQQQNILKSAQSMFFTYGFKRITMDEVAQKVGISKKTLYQYHPNKQELVKATVANFINQQRAKVEAIHREEINAIDELQKIYETTCHHLTEINPGSGLELQRYFPESWEVFQEHKKNFMYHHIYQNLEKGIKEGLYREDFDLQIIASYYIARIDLILDAQLFPPSKFSFQQILKEFFIYHIRGIASHKGLNYLENHTQLKF